MIKANIGLFMYLISIYVLSQLSPGCLLVYDLPGVRAALKICMEEGRMSNLLVSFKVVISILLVSMVPVGAFCEDLPSGFWQIWGDGRAELNSYDIKVPRYGESRGGRELLIFVTEDFDPERQVKREVESPTGAALKVLKLIRRRRFQTGVYSYQLMTSVFSPLTGWKLAGMNRPAIVPIKVTFSATEWCGMVYQQFNSHPQGFRELLHSYFEREGDREVLHSYQQNSFLEDNLFIRVRELTHPFPDGSYRVLSSAMYSRLSHQPVDWGEATVKKSKEVEAVTIGTEEIYASMFSVVVPDRTYKIWVESKGQKRIVKWQVKHLRDLGVDSVETAVLVTSLRSSYWDQHSNADSDALNELGPSF